MKKTGVLNKKNVSYFGIVLLSMSCQVSWAARTHVHESHYEQVGVQSPYNSAALSPEELDYLNDDVGIVVTEEKSSLTDSGKALLERVGIFVLDKWLRMQAFVKKNGIFCKQYLYNVLKRFKN